ncbi:3'-5' exonuclease [Kamptonema animale CS-326]|jgi:DNA polymerase-3 subunit epsilon|uniref:3'-5' exonuclease n=1 Tax=Kamptonema animale TaxID=92934 RepID=UPI0023300927|nr:3'-5' exonuclease [Kamptonema animale]MDB9514797.1 3'-5' exonuclease [Kamptonema animale CS-326]
MLEPTNNELKEYKWWGSPGEPPPQLKTKKQLAEMGLRPIKAVGRIETRKYDLLLYDPTNSESVGLKRKASDKQKEALEKGRKAQRYKAWYREIGWMYEDRNDAIKWAKSLASKDNFLILDTETTEFFMSQIVQIGIIDMNGQIILDSLVKPTIQISSEAIAIHGITNDMVANAPSFPDIYPQIQTALEGKQVITYNAAFDRKILNYCCELHGLKSLGLSKRSHCAMEWYAEYFGQWSPYYKSYKWQPLQGGNHTAIGDCLACLSLINEMASEDVKPVKEIFDDIQ